MHVCVYRRNKIYVIAETAGDFIVFQRYISYVTHDLTLGMIVSDNEIKEERESENERKMNGKCKGSSGVTTASTVYCLCP